MGHKKIANNALELIGSTPLVRLNKVVPNGVEVLGKCEFMTPGGSVKDRAGSAMLAAAELSGQIDQETVIIEPTSGNTGIALAFVAAVKGYRVIVTMPDSMSLERQKILRAFGAEVDLTPGHLGMQGAIQRAEALSKTFEKSFIPQQFNNPANPQAHRDTTAEEIWRDTDGKVDGLVIAVGTGGSVSGIGSALKKKNPQIKVMAVEPEDSAVLSGQEPGPHMIQGIGAGFVPNNVDRSVIDEVVTVSNDEALTMARRLAAEEGLLVGISAGANVHGATQVAQRPEWQGKRLVTILCDYGERYLSTTLYR